MTRHTVDCPEPKFLKYKYLIRLVISTLCVHLEIIDHGSQKKLRNQSITSFTVTSKSSAPFSFASTATMGARLPSWLAAVHVFDSQHSLDCFKSHLTI